MAFQSRFQERIPGLDTQDDLNSITSLEEMAKAQGYKESKSFSALQVVGRALNFTNATTAGAVRGIFTKEGILKSTARSIKENSSWQDIYKDLGWKPKTKSDKIVKGVVSFTSDVLFDPLTYLTLGAGTALKIAGKPIAKGASREAVKGLEKELFTSSYENLLGEGLEKSTARILARQESNDVLKRVIDEAVSKDGLTTTTFDSVTKKILDTKNIDYIKDMGSAMLDKGGIKWFGKQLVTSEALKNSMVGKVARKIGEQEVIVALKNSFGKLFSYGFQKDPRILKIFEKLDFENKRAIKDITDTLKKELDDVPSESTYNVLKSALAKKRSLLKMEDEITKGVKAEYKKLFPKEKFPVSFEEIESVASNRTTTLTKIIEKLTKDISNKDIGSLQEKINEARKALNNLTPKKDIQKAAVTVTEEEFEKGLKFAFGLKEQRLKETLIELESLLKRTEPITDEAGKKVTKTTMAGLSKEEVAANLFKRIKQIQDDVVTKSNFFTKAANARRLAKKRLATEVLNKTIDGKNFNEIEQKLADRLFNEKDSLITQLARESGLPDEDAIKFYLTETLDDHTTIKEFSTGRNLTPNLDFAKRYRGLTDVAETLDEKNARKVLMKTFTQVKSAKLKTQAIKDTINSVGVPFDKMTTKQADELGYELLSKKTPEGLIQGWLPKELMEQVKSHLTPQPSVINDLAHASGFDYVTGLFKGLVTSIFPGFHIRNFGGNEWNSFLQFGMSNFDPKNAEVAFDILRNKNLDKKIIDKFGNEYTYKEIKELIAKESDLLDSVGAFSESEQFLNGVDNLSKFQLWNPLSRRNIALEKGRKIGHTIESFSKLKGVINTVRSGGLISDGIAASERAMFNYQKLTPFERDIMRRVIPFYTFARKNFEFQLKALSQTPGRVASQFKLLNGLGNSIAGDNEFDDETKLPHWIINSMGINAGYKGVGQKQIFTGFGVPTEEFLQRFSGPSGIIWNTVNNTLSQANPIIKFPLERATDKDFFRQRPVSEISNADGMKWFIDALDKSTGGVGQQFKELIQWKEMEVPVYINGKKTGTRKKYTANPFALHLFRNLPTSRIQSTIRTITDTQNSSINTAVGFFTGVRGWTIDIEQQKFFTELEKKKELVKFLTRVGVMKTYEVNYVPK